MADKEYITIDRFDHDELIITETRYNILIDALFETAHLSYDGKKLAFDAYPIEGFIKILCPNRYEKVYNALKEMDADET